MVDSKQTGKERVFSDEPRHPVEDKSRNGQYEEPENDQERQTRLPESYLEILSKGIKGIPPSESQILWAIAMFKSHLREERNEYYAEANPLRPEWVKALSGFFCEHLLSEARFVELKGRRITNPFFYSRAKTMGFRNLPDISHEASAAFLDVVVFNEPAQLRELFHALVQMVQMQVLGIDDYAELLVRGFQKAHSHFLVPLRSHAFSLDARFVADGEKRFSVEDEVRHWAGAGLYRL